MDHKEYREGLDQTGGVNAYFQSLPPQVQEMVRQRRLNIQSEDALRRCVDNLLDEDK